MNPTEALSRMRQVIRLQHKALATEDTYLYWLRRYMTAVHRMPVPLPSEQKVERFLTDLAQKQHVAASTQNQAFNAVLFFYKEVLRRPLGRVEALRATRPTHLRHAPPVQDTHALLRAVQDRAGFPTNLISRLIYGCGLRVSEPLNL